MNRFRRILTRWEIREDTYYAMLHFACGIIAWRADEGEGQQDVLKFPGGSATFNQTTPIEVAAAKAGRAIVIGYVGRYQVRAPVTVSAN